MVKPRKKISYSDSYPQFFKIYVPDQSSQRLRIPPAFVKNFNGVSPINSVLRNPAGKSWRVDVNKFDDNLFFEKGWVEFVQENSLEFGDFLIFAYAGNSIFFAIIYGKNSCRKDVAITTSSSQPLLQPNESIEPSMSKEQVPQRTLHSRVVMAIQENDAVGEFVSMYPFFKMVLTPAYVSKGFLCIPGRFHKSSMSKKRPRATLRFSDKSWPVKLSYYGNRLLFCQGWGMFVKDNTLQAGHVCIFELIESTKYVLEVSIFRCSS